MENELLAITLAQMMVLSQNLAHVKSINIVLISHVICHVTILLKKRKLLTNWWPVEEKKSGKNIFLIHIINRYF